MISKIKSQITLPLILKVLQSHHQINMYILVVEMKNAHSSQKLIFSLYLLSSQMVKNTTILKKNNNMTENPGPDFHFKFGVKNMV